MSTFQVFRGQVMGPTTTQDVVALFPDDISGRFTEASVYIVFDADASAGSVVVESAHSATYAGTWATVATVNFVAASRVHVVSMTGVYLATRIRIATTIADGTVTAYLVATN